MSYLALYRKYRPVSFDDFVGQNDNIKIIKNEILNNKLSHAYLFSGPRGTGKTSTAKIIAKMINCSNLSKDGIPCGKCSSCLNPNSNDIVEIDAASNNGVDEIRELRDKVNLVPSFGKYKVYIIDEVHMLTTQAFNALLKTLEEPPSHAIFILATTEFYKIPSTVVSRCQKFQFLRFTIDEIIDRLKYICNKEKISIDDDVLFEIARLSDGGLRDAINMLDQLSSYSDGNIILSDVYSLNGVVSFDDMFLILELLSNCDVQKIVLFVDNLNNKGINLDKFIFDFVDFLKDVLIYKSSSFFNSNNKLKNDNIVKASDLFELNDIYDLIIKFNDILNQMKNSGFSKILLIVNLIKISNLLKNSNINDNSNDDISNANKVVDNDSVKTSDINIIVEKDKSINNSTIFSSKLKKIRINNSFATASKNLKEEFSAKWNNLKDNLSSVKYNSLIGFIDDVDVMVVGKNNAIFVVRYDSLLDRIYNYLDIFEDMLSEFFNNKYEVVFLDNDEWEYEKKCYIDAVKSGKKYSYIEENIEKNDNNVYTNNDVDKLISIVGNDVITYK